MKGRSFVKSQNLKLMVQAQLQLIFLPAIRCLIHYTKLNFNVVKTVIPKSQIEPVAVENLNCLSVSDVVLTIIKISL